MTAEELADIDNLARALRLAYYNRRADDEEWGRLDLLSKNAWRRVANAHTTIKAQAQRIAELEAQLATAQAVTLTEEERVVFRDAKIWVNLQGINPARPMVRQLTDIIDRLTGASTPAQEGEKL